LPFIYHAAQYKVMPQNIFDVQLCSMDNKEEDITRNYSTETKFLRSLKHCILCMQQNTSAQLIVDKYPVF
jgi:hypothetical protein